jgi:hypothetical protein
MSVLRLTEEIASIVHGLKEVDSQECVSNKEAEVDSHDSHESHDLNQNSWGALVRFQFLDRRSIQRNCEQGSQ